MAYEFRDAQQWFRSVGLSIGEFFGRFRFYVAQFLDLCLRPRRDSGPQLVSIRLYFLLSKLFNFHIARFALQANGDGSTPHCIWKRFEARDHFGRERLEICEADVRAFSD